MESNMRIVGLDKKGNLIGEKGELLVPPKNWAFLPAGDAGVTRKVTSAGEFWRVQVKMGKRIISKGIWAPEATILQVQNEVKSTRLTDDYKKTRETTLKRREKKQEQYDAEFCASVESYLNFHERYKLHEQQLARAITTHAIPIGSGTVARTQTIPIEERAAHAVIAWMRHQTTAYDQLKIARIKGERRAVRRTLAQQSVALLSNYRDGKPISENCLLQKAINQLNQHNS